MNLESQCTAAVSWIHDFFVAWFRGERQNSDEAWSNLDRLLAPGFVLVSPGGMVLRRDALLSALRAQHGQHANTHFSIEVRNVEIRHELPHAVVVGYEEWQVVGDVRTARASTAILSLGEELTWLHVHETWLPGQGPPT